jgi:uncharacterized membrane protein
VEPENEKKGEKDPLKRQGYYNTMAHFYRGELQRTNTWRTRLDRTANWAIIVIAAILTFAFSSEGRPHFVLLIGILIVFLLLIIESRRYRTYIVWKSRVRVLEKNFLAPVLCEEENVNHEDWKKILAADLKQPVQKIEFLEAFSRRLRRVYNWLFLILVGSWFIRVGMYPQAAASVKDIFERASVGPIAGQVMVLTVAGFLVFILVISLYRWETRLGIFEREAKGHIKPKEKAKYDWTDWLDV